MTDDEIRALVDDPELRTGVSAVELAEAFLGRLEEAHSLNAMITVTPELALAHAREVDVRRDRGERLPLDGMPIVLKDNIDVAGVPTTVGSRLFAGRVPTEDAEVTRRLRAAGAVILGKANMHELAFGATSANEAFGAVLNPAAPDRIPGGSSGGSGAAVAADLCLAAIGTDTGGSVRLPASLCGVSGIRPTYGAVSNRGVQPMAASLDTVGPLARAVTDVRSLLAVIAGFDPEDTTSRDRPLVLDGVDEMSGMRVGVVEAFLAVADPGVASCVRSLAEMLEELGASLTEVELTGWEDAVDACSRLITGRGADSLRRGACEPAGFARGRHQAAPRAGGRPGERRPRAAASRKGALGRRARGEARRGRPAADADDPGRGALRRRRGHGGDDQCRRPLHLRLRVRARLRPVAPVRDDRGRGSRRGAARRRPLGATASCCGQAPPCRPQRIGTAAVRRGRSPGRRCPTDVRDLRRVDPDDLVRGERELELPRRLHAARSGAGRQSGRPRPLLPSTRSAVAEPAVRRPGRRRRLARAARGWRRAGACLRPASGRRGPLPRARRSTCRQAPPRPPTRSRPRGGGRGGTPRPRPIGTRRAARSRPRARAHPASPSSRSTSPTTRRPRPRT